MLINFESVDMLTVRHTIHNGCYYVFSQCENGRWFPMRAFCFDVKLQGTMSCIGMSMCITIIRICIRKASLNARMLLDYDNYPVWCGDQ